MKENLRLQVAQACRILVDRGLDSGFFGNVSARIPGTEEYWQNPVGLTFNHITEDEVIRVDTSGRVIEGAHGPHPGEFIHREIYRRRPDVGAVVHTHSPDTVLMSLFGVEIEPFTQVGASINGDQGIYLGFSGPVRSSDEGAAIAGALGKRSFVIAKNHGIFAAGKNIKEALWNMIIVDQASREHLRAKQLGLAKADVPSTETLVKSRREVRDAQYERAWGQFLVDLNPRSIPDRSFSKTRSKGTFISPTAIER